MLVACRAYGLRPIDGPFGDFSDPDGFRAAANRAAVLGYEGKWAIHPSQIALCNEVFTPSAAEVAKARRIIEAMEQAAREGRGAVSLDGTADRLRQHPHGGGVIEEGEVHGGVRSGPKMAARAT